jgi:hypothetical protein
MPKRTVKERFELYNRLVKSLLIAIVAFGGGFAGLIGSYQTLTELFGILTAKMLIEIVLVAIGALAVAIFVVFAIMWKLNRKEKE